MTNSCNQISDDGLASNEFLINEEFIAMLDHYVVKSLPAKLSEAQPSESFIASDGQKGRRNWEPALLEFLDRWLRLFPEIASMNKGRFSVSLDDL